MKKTSYIMVIIMAFVLAADNCPAFDDEGIDIHGFISQGYLESTDNNFIGNTVDGSFEFNEFGINFASNLTDKLRVGVQFFSKDFGPYGNNDVAIDWALGDYHWKDWMGFRIGKVKTPYGLYNETRDVDMLRTWIFLPQSVYTEVLRESTLNLLGGGIYGEIYMDAFGAISYKALIGTQNIDANEHLAETIMGITYGGTEVENDSIDVGKKYVLHLEWATPLSGLRVAGTFSKVEMDLVSHFDFTGTIWEDVLGVGSFSTNLNSKSYVVSAEYTWDNLMIASEYTWSTRDLVYTRNETWKPDGWYLGGSYRFGELFELGGYYSEYYGDRNDRKGEGIGAFGPIYDPQHRAYLKDTALTTRFDINMFWTVKLEYHMFNGTGTLSPFDNLIPDDGSEQFTKDWNMIAAKSTFSF